MRRKRIRPAPGGQRFFVFIPFLKGRSATMRP
jgi:hypothetical protein